LAGLEGNYLTALRTGAASGVATYYLAKKDSSVLAIIGAGFQARTQLEAIFSVRYIKSVNIYDINEQQSIKYLELMKNKFSNVSLKWTISYSAEEAIENADIICITTTSKTPVFSGEKIKVGIHVNAVGSFTPQTQEIDIQTLLKADKIYVDSIEVALKETGDLIIPIQKGKFNKTKINGEIGEIISKQKIGRENNEEITIFKTVGLSIQDMAIGFFIYRKAKKMGLGKEISLD
jgi:ornithine cyclodeaminase/alanine dehydrogenase-like protein (mu-crystallin family)